MNRSPEENFPPDPVSGSAPGYAFEIEFVGDAEVHPEIVCWRCHKAYPENLVECAHCGAKNKAAAALIQFSEPADHSTSPLKVVLVCYGVLLLGSLLLAGFVQLSVAGGGGEDPNFVGPILALEIVDTIVVLIAMGMSGLAIARIDPVPKFSMAAIAWLLFFPGLVLMFLCNQAYHEWLIQILQIPRAENIYPDSWPILILLYCIQPAIIEELFARQMSLAVFRQYMGLHFSVFITALMFALMHIFVPLSVPYLFALGIFLGYARVFGGTIFLPMILHFLHNLIVIISERS